MIITKKTNFLDRTEYSSDEAISSVNSAVSLINFQIEDEHIVSASILNKEFYYIRFETTEEVDSFLDNITKSKNTILIPSLEFCIKHLPSYQSAKFKEIENLIDIRILLYFCNNFLSDDYFLISLNVFLDKYKIDSSNLQNIQKQRLKLFDILRININFDNLEKLLPLNISSEYHYQLCLALEKLYKAIILQINNVKTYEKLINLQNKVYIPLYFSLFEIEQQGIKLDLFSINKLKPDNITIEKVIGKIKTKIDSTWKIYPRYNATRSKTGRISSTDQINYCALPNYIKKYIIKNSLNDKLVYFDYNASDYRTAVALANVNLDLNFDINNYLAEYLFGELNEINRNKAKMFLYQSLYGNDLKHVWGVYKLNKNKFKDITEHIGLGYVLKYIKEIQIKSEGGGYLVNYLGRFKEISENINRSIKSNYCIQSVSNIISLHALNEVTSLLHKMNMDDKIILFEHDGMYINFSSKYERSIEKRINVTKDLMENEVPSDIFGRKEKFMVRIKEVNKYYAEKEN